MRKEAQKSQAESAMLVESLGKNQKLINGRWRCQNSLKIFWNKINTSWLNVVKVTKL